MATPQRRHHSLGIATPGGPELKTRSPESDYRPHDGGSPPMADLLSPHATVREHNAFLLQALEAGDTERQVLLERFAALADIQRPLHDARAELAARTAELQQQRHEGQQLRLCAAEEREKTARLSSENLVLAARVDDDRTKIAALLSLRKAELGTPASGAAAHTAGGPRIPVVTSRGVVAAAAASVPPACGYTVHSTRALPTEHTAARVAASVTPSAPLSSPPQPQPQSLSLRAAAAAAQLQLSEGVAPAALALGVPEEDPPLHSTLPQALSAEAAALRDLLDQQRAHYERDRLARVAAAREDEQRQARDVARLRAHAEQLQGQLTTATRDLCEYRHATQIDLRELRGDVEGLTVRCAEAERLLSIERQRRTADLQVALDSQHARSATVADKLRVQLREVDHRRGAERAALEQQLAAKSDEVDRLRRELGLERRRRERVEARRRAEATGRQADVDLVRQQLRQVEKRVYFEAHRQAALDAPIPGPDDGEA